MSCEPEPIPLFMLKYCLHTPIVLNTKIMNLLLCFPSHLKNAHINSLLKKQCLPANDLNSNIPISNLSFISKVLEKKK